jgi:hypothetical protein
VVKKSNPATDEAKVKSVINEYFLAINDQNWSKSKSCCVYSSGTYYETCDMEQYVNSLVPYGVVTITCVVKIPDVSIYSNYAQAYGNGTLNISCGSISDSSVGAGYIYLQKISNSWKIYGS